MRAVLMLHGVDASGSVLSVTPGQLRSLVQGIRAARHEIVPLSELLAGGTPDRVALSFDDGFRSVYEGALPVLQEEGVPAVLFLTTGFVGGYNDWPGQPAWAPRQPMLDWSQVEALQRAGWAVEAHTRSHPDLRALPEPAILEEMEAANRTIEQHLGRRPELFAPPYGSLDPRVLRLAQGLYQHVLTTRMAPLDGLSAQALREQGVPRLDAFYLRSPWLHAHFGGARFRGWLGLRAGLRKLRRA